jgi:ABC-type tungstate transport system substrate-binding protein
VVPLLASFRYLRPGLVNDINEIGQALLLTFIGALIAAPIAIAFAVAARIGAPRLLQGFDRKSLRVFIALFLLQAVPAICVGLCGYEWTSLLSHYSILQQISIWLVGQSILALPLLAGFVLWIHFHVTTRELEFQEASQVSLREMTLWTFFNRFNLEYVLVLIFAFSFIWNEDTLNRIMSDAIPSLVHRLGARVTGRGTSYSEAATLVVFSIALSLIMVMAWNTLLSRGLRREDG